GAVHRPAEDAEECAADADGGHRDTDREQDGVGGERDESQPPAADEAAEDEEQDRQERQADEHANADPEAHPGPMHERLARAAREPREEDDDEQPEQKQADEPAQPIDEESGRDRKSTRLNSSHGSISYAVFCLKK